MQATFERHVACILASARYHYCTYARCDCFDNLTVAAAFVVYTVLTNIDEEEDEESRIKCQKDGGWLKRRQVRGVFEGGFETARG